MAVGKNRRAATWFIDYVSPYPYLQLPRLEALVAASDPPLDIRPVPVLFAGLLNHWGHKGPAEIREKARHFYTQSRWLAGKRGLPFTGPPRHPFNPLALLRLTEAAGPTLATVRTVFAHVWGDGQDGQSDESIAALAARLGVENHAARLADPSLKARIRANTDAAIGAGVFGVPTLLLDGRLFWGDDTTEMFAEYLSNPALFDHPDFARIDRMQAAAERVPRMG